MESEPIFHVKEISRIISVITFGNNIMIFKLQILIKVKNFFKKSNLFSKNVVSSRDNIHGNFIFKNI